MRHTKKALLVFGAGLLLGLLVVTFQLTPLGRVASGLMALGLIAMPIGLVFDWGAIARKPALAKRRRSSRRSAAATRRRARPRSPRTPDR